MNVSLIRNFKAVIAIMMLEICILSDRIVHYTRPISKFEAMHFLLALRFEKKNPRCLDSNNSSTSIEIKRTLVNRMQIYPQVV